MFFLYFYITFCFSRALDTFDFYAEGIKSTVVLIRVTTTHWESKQIFRINYGYERQPS
jgi:hypothetical protein